MGAQASEEAGMSRFGAGLAYLVVACVASVIVVGCVAAVYVIVAAAF